MAHLSFPNESVAYREARNALLDAEIELRAHSEKVAAMRRALPPGGAVPEDYVFERIGEHGVPEHVRLSELFHPHDTLILYSFMYGPEKTLPCPGCTHLLDGMNGAGRHVEQRASLYIAAKSPLARLVEWARVRGWDHLRMLSTAGNNYTADYFGDTSRLSPEMRSAHGIAEGEDWDETIYNVFRREDGNTIRHFWGSEMTYAPSEPGQHHRSGDAANPLWGLLDMTPEGRGSFFPKVWYD